MDPEYQRLLNSAFDDQLTEAELARLEERLAAGEDAEEFVQFLTLHLTLAEQTAPVRPFSGPELRAVSEVEERFSESSLSGTVTSRSALSGEAEVRESRISRGWLGFACGIAISLCFALFFAWHQLPGLKADSAASVDASKDSRRPQEAEAPTQVAARIVKKIDCVWENDRWMVAAPASFRKGEMISLTSGLLVLEFESGAQVTIQGPASATPVSENALALYSGGMTAVIPEQARGFSVRTSSGEIIDLGTEFGIFASEDGSVETHVFKGEVLSKLGATRGNTTAAESSINAGEAQVVSSNGDMRKTTAQENRFARLGFGLDRLLAELPSVDRGLVLWLAADGRVQLDARGKVMAWGDNPTDQNRQIEDVWQVHAPKRPRWSKESINGKPGIRFGGNTMLVSEPIELGSDFTTAIVFKLESSEVPAAFENIRNLPKKKHAPRPDLGIQLLNLYGPPHPVIQIDEELSLSARVHLGRDPQSLRDVNIGEQATPPIVDNAAHIVVYSFDSKTKTVRLFLDGELVSESQNVPDFAPTFTPRYIGNHPYRAYHGFCGHIAEIMIHDVALTQHEVGDISAWLGDKYHIQVAFPE